MYPKLLVKNETSTKVAFLTSWSHICCSSTKYAVMEALGQMSPLLSDDRISKSVTPVISMLITLYKRSSHVIEPYHVTQCISCLLKAVVDRDPAILDTAVEQLLTALFVQVSPGFFCPKEE